MSAEDRGFNKGKRLERMSDGTLQWISTEVFPKKKTNRLDTDTHNLTDLMGGVHV
jgi:hypothetical protein